MKALQAGRRKTAPDASQTKPRRKYTLTRQALAARRANLAKARAVPREVRYRPTEKRQAASRANIQRAIAWRRSPEGNARARLNSLKHGLYARPTEDAARRLNQAQGEYAEHLRLFDQVYAPQDDAERKLVRRLADAVWRRLQLFHAQGQWELTHLHQVFRDAPRAARLTPGETEMRAYALLHVLWKWDRFRADLGRLESEIENLLRRLLRRRSAGRALLQVLAPRRERVLTEARELGASDILEIWQHLSPARRAQVLRQVEAQLAKKSAPRESQEGRK